MLLLREASHLREDDPRLWALYGVQCLRSGRVEAGKKALVQAAWLRDRQGEPRKARVIRALLSRTVPKAA